MIGKQIGLWEVPVSNCYFGALLEDDDNRCIDINPKQRNEVFSCNTPKTYQILSHIGGVGFNVSAEPTPVLELPSFFPTLPSGSQQLVSGIDLPYVGVSLGKILSKQKLNLADDIRKRIGVGPKSKLVLLSFGHDELIENAWPERHGVFKSLSNSGLCLITAVNYSVWFEDPHAERLINLKRSLLTFAEMQAVGLPTVPLLYWAGKKDLQRWLEWLEKNTCVKLVSLNLQTERAESSWHKTLEDIKFLNDNLKRPMHFLINGPKTLRRINQLFSVVDSFTLTTSFPALKAAYNKILKLVGDEIVEEHSYMPVSEIFRRNVDLYQMIATRKIPAVSFMSEQYEY